MKITFLGTRGNIENRTQTHNNHTSALIEYYGKQVMIDAGEDWSGELEEVNPYAIVVTHAHPDHAFGLKKGSPCDVYTTQVSWKDMKDYEIEKSKRKLVKIEKEFTIGDIHFKAFSVEHSTRAPAVSYKITAGNSTIFYAPDLIYVHNREEAFKEVDLYIGDGATITTSFVRKQDDNLIGHATIDAQLAWCEKDGMERAIITHCGSEIVDNDGRKINAKIRKMGKERGIKAEVAHDGMEVVLR